jgi:endonuclease/exonuclease/phosphatase family metal-dependent hydrolase
MSVFKTIWKAFQKHSNPSDDVEDFKKENEPSLKLLTFNACLFPYMMQPSFHSSNKKERLPLIIDFLVEQSEAGYEVICLQEVFSSLFSSFYKDQILSDTRIQKAFPYVFQSPLFGFCQHKKIVDSGLLILSKLPITNRAFVQFNDNHGWMMPCLKGYMICEVYLNDKPIVLVNTHLQPNCSTLINRKKYEKIRYYQCSQIRDSLWDILGSAGFYSTPIVITGDFNVDQNCEKSNEFNSLKRVLHCDQFSTCLETTINTFLPFSKNYEQQTLDYAIGKNLGFQSTSIMSSKKSLSDHFPVGFEIIGINKVSDSSLSDDT